MSEKDPVLSEYYNLLIACGQMESAYEEKLGKPLSSVVKEIATAIFIQKHPRDYGKGKPQGNGQQAPSPGQRAPRGTDRAECPKCGGEIYNNRKANDQKFAAGETKLRPEFACRDKSCGWVQWHPRAEKKKEEPEPVGSPVEREVADQDSDLPF